MCSVTDAIEAAKAVLTKPPMQCSDGFYMISIDCEAHAQLVAQLERALINVEVLGRGLQALLTAPPAIAPGHMALNGEVSDAKN